MEDKYHSSLGRHLLKGYYVRAEADPKQAEIFSGENRRDQLLLDFPSIQKLDRNNRDPQAYFGQNTIVGSTTMIKDSTLHSNTPLNFESRVIARVGPHFHIGCDMPTYDDMSKEDRLENIEDYLQCIHAQAEYFSDKSTVIVPALLGVNPDEYKKCYYGFRGHPGIKEILDGNFAVYVGQRFGPKHGCQIKQMENELWDIDATCNPEYMLVVGYESPWRLENLPGSVSSIAGLQQFIKKTDFRNNSLSTTRKNLGDLRNEVEKNLGIGTQQLTFDNFSESKT